MLYAKSDNHFNTSKSFTLSSENVKDLGKITMKGGQMLEEVAVSAVVAKIVDYFPENVYVDLGLSVKWAICNVGADKPEDVGGLYAWGETEPKDFYFWDTYKYCDGTYNSLTKYTDSAYGKDGFSDNKSVLDPEDDVAHVKWGGNWRIPTKEELEELRTKCTWTSTTLNGVKGYSVTSNVDGYTDRSIFLPATGMRIRQWTENTDTIGRFWGNSIVTGDDYDAVYLDFNFSRGPGRFSIIRCFGQCVRPVCP